MLCCAEDRTERRNPIVADANWRNRTMWTGDNMPVLRGLNSESIDLVYADPPFNSNKNYAAPIGSKAAGAAFKDTWALSDVDEAWHGEIAEREPEVYAAIDAAGIVHGPGMKSYLIMMAVRLMEIRRVLKPTGSLYLHCDDTADAYLRMLCDAVFGSVNLRSKITWKRHNARSSGRRWPRVHDTILYVSKSDGFKFTPTKVAGDTAKLPHTLITGPDGKKYQTYELTGAGVTAEGESGRPWRGYDPTEMGRHWGNSHRAMDEWDRAGLIHWPRKTGARGGFPRRRAAEPFIPAARQVTIGDVWTDIDRINQTAKERVGYPTQKPLSLLDRIITASTREGDVVLDPFCGCATACVSAESLHRQWIGIDLSPMAARLVESRLRDEFKIFAEIHHRTDVPRRTDTGPLPNYRTHKHQLFGRQEGRCAGCQVPFPFRNFTIDHRVPRSAGGTDHIDNLQLLCGACNSVKGQRDHAALIVTLEERGILPARAKPIKATLGGRRRARAKSG